MFAPTLSPEEFASLTKIGTDPLLAAPVASEHLLKLVGLRYIVAVETNYEATTAGRLRIAYGR
jgi:hypothetical protein